MRNKNTKQRLFEIMSKVDKSFKYVLNEELKWSSDGGYYNKSNDEVMVSPQEAEYMKKVANKLYNDLFTGEKIAIPENKLALEIINKLHQSGVKIENDTDEENNTYYWISDDIESAKEEFNLIVDNLYDRVQELIGELTDLSKYNIKVTQPDYSGTIRRLSNGKWLLYDSRNKAEDAGPFNTVESLIDYFEITKDQLSGDYVKYLEENLHEQPNDDLLEFIIPEWALSTLINGDSSGISDEDDQKIDDFVDNIVAKYGNADFMLDDVEGKDNLGFCRSNDIDNLGTNCYRLYLRQSK